MKSTSKRIVLAAVLGLVAGAAGQARAELLLNPSFEQPVLADGTVAGFSSGETIGAGWVVQSGNASIITKGFTVEVPPGTFWPGPSAGNQYLYDGSNLVATTVYQDVSLAAATAYQLTFDMANFLGGGLGSGARVNVDVTINGVSVIGGPTSFTLPLGAGYTTESLDFTTAGAGTYRLLLEQPGGYGTNIDNLSLSAELYPHLLIDRSTHSN